MSETVAKKIWRQDHLDNLFGPLGTDQPCQFDPKAGGRQRTRLGKRNRHRKAHVGGFSVMNNHLHLLLRLDPEVAQSWSDSGRASISAELAGVFVRLGCSAQSWQIQIEKLRGDRLQGRFFAASRAKLREIGERLGVRRLVKLKGCPIR